VIERPPTIIVVHPKERRKKCTVEPLRDREDFRFWKFPRQGPECLKGYVRLGLRGPLLTTADVGRGLLLLDGTWKLVDRMLPDYEQLPVRSLLPWRTAYPRVSKLYEDPAPGLATIEALFAAFWQTGRDTSGLLDRYHWKDEFLEINSEQMSGKDRRLEVWPSLSAPNAASNLDNWT
jgi:rRNA small subunit aminocarboxypropyltransferase